MNKNNIYDNLSDDKDIVNDDINSDVSDDLDESNNSSSSSDATSDEIDIDLYVRDTNGKMQIQPIKKLLSKKNRLICFSSINKKECTYGKDCIYAHSLEEQHIDFDKLFSYQIILDENLMDYYSITNPNMINIYRKIMILTNICDSALANKCSGGYNCKYGTHAQCLKVCKNDFLMGDCLNKIIRINIDPVINKKITNIKLCQEYIGCINGHHLTSRGFVPYYKFSHEKEKQSRNKFISHKCIDLDDVSRMINRAVITDVSSSDDEINEILNDYNSEQE